VNGMRGLGVGLLAQNFLQHLSLVAPPADGESRNEEIRMGNFRSPSPFILLMLDVVADYWVVKVTPEEENVVFFLMKWSFFTLQSAGYANLRILKWAN